MPRPNHRRTALLVGSLVVAFLGRADLPRADRAAPTLPVHQFRLENGLTVVLAPDRSVSNVRVLVRYRGGAADEPADRAGFTHFVERLFVDGTVHTKAGEHEQRIDAAGGWTTSTTTLDNLTLSTEVPPGALELALWLEAERMAGLADGITDARMTKERDAIAAAYRAAYIDQPYGLVARATRNALWPDGHGNRRDILGDANTLARGSVADVRAFVRERIRPDRATLVIVGNFWPGKTTPLVRRYLGWIPGRRDAGDVSRGNADATPRGEPRAIDGQRVGPLGAPPVAPLGAPVALVVADPVAQIVVAYRVPVEGDSELELAVLARILTGSPTARLERTLVDPRRASEVRADVVLHARGGAFEIHATPSPGADPKRIAADIRAEIASLAHTAPSDAVVAAIRTSVERERILAIETLAGRAATLDHWRGLESIDAYVATVRRTLERVTPAQLQTRAKSWLAETSAITVIAGPEAR